MAASVFPSGFLDLSSGMTFAAVFSSGLAAAPGFSALLTGAVSLPPILPGVFAGVAGFFASAGAGGDLTDASGFFTSPVGTVSLRLSLPDASAFLTSAGGSVPDLSSGFWGSAAEAGFMPSFLSGGFSVLGGAFGSFAASGFFSGAGCLLRVAFSSGIVFLLHRKNGYKKCAPSWDAKTTRRFTGRNPLGRRRDSKNLLWSAPDTKRQADMRGCYEWVCWFSAYSPAHR